MGIFAGPGVIEDGLVLALDAANQKSHNLTAVEVLVVAGGGGGGTHHGGGGGAGGLIYNSNFAVTPGSALTVTVGNGGAGGTYSPNANGSNGGNSVFGSLTAVGGGGGGTYNNNANSSGGSGGGANNWSTSRIGGSGTSGQGFAGGSNNGQTNYGGGGGGASGTAKGLSNNSGGDGLEFSISGTATYYAGGGAAGVYPGYTNATSYGIGGLGGGGNGGDGPHNSGTTPGNGSPNTGGGGGGVADLSKIGGSGGSGIVIVRYPGPQKAIGGTVTSVNGYTIHTFTDVGSTTFTPLAATNNSAILGLSDLSGNNNFGTSANGPTYSSSNRGSIVFDGVNDYVDCGSITTGGKITVNAWVKITTGARYQHIVDSSSNSWHLAILNDNRPYFWNGSTYHTAAQVLSTSTWYMLTGVQSSTLDIYVNGVLSQSLSSNLNVTTNNVNIGRYQSGSRPFIGNIAQVSVYNRALTATEIQKNFNAQRGRFGI